MATFKKISELVDAGYVNNAGLERIEIVAYTGVNSDIPISQSLRLVDLFNWAFYERLPAIGGIAESSVYSMSGGIGATTGYGAINYINLDTSLLYGGQYPVYVANIAWGNSNEISAQQWNVGTLTGLNNFGKELSLLLGGSTQSTRGKVISFKNVFFPESMPKTLRIAFDDLLDTTQTLSASDFTLTGVTGVKHVNHAVFMDDRTVGLRVENVYRGENLTLAIASGAVRDVAGNLVAATTTTPVINTGNKINTDALNVALCAVKNTTPSVIEIIFNQMLDLSLVLDPAKFTLSGGKTVISATYKNTSTVVLSVTTFTAGESITITIAANAVLALVKVGLNSLITGVAITNKVGVTDSTPPAISTVFTVPQVFIDAGKPYYIHAGNNTVGGVYDLLVLKKVTQTVWHVASFQEGFI